MVSIPQYGARLGAKDLKCGGDNVYVFDQRLEGRQLLVVGTP